MLYMTNKMIIFNVFTQKIFCISTKFYMNFPIIQHIYKYFHDNVFCIKHETKTMLECVLFINLMFEHRNNGCVNHETMDILLNIKLCSFCLRTRKMVIIFVKSSVRKMSECTHRNKPDIM